MANDEFRWGSGRISNRIARILTVLAAWRRVVHAPVVLYAVRTLKLSASTTCINVESVCMWHVRWHVLRSHLTPGIARGTA